MSRDHERYVESTGAYLLGALPELEAKAFERHVMACTDCRDEIERLRPAADALPRSVTPLNPPATLKRSLMSAASSAFGESEQRRERRPGILGRRAANGRTWLRLGVAVASVALLIGLGGLGGFGIARLGDEADQGRKIAAAVDGGRLAEGSGSLLLPSPGDEEARPVLTVHGLPPLPSEGDTDEVYQLWLVRQNEVIPSSVFSVSADGSGTAGIPDRLDDVDAVWVTRERAGGARAPSEQPVMRMNLS